MSVLHDLSSENNENPNPRHATAMWSVHMLVPLTFGVNCTARPPRFSILMSSKNPPTDQWSSVRQLIANKNYGEALRVMQTLPATALATQEALELCLVCHQALRDSAKVVELLRKLVANYPQLTLHHYSLATTLAQHGQFYDAMQVYENLLASSHATAISHYNCAVLLQNLGQPERALAQYQRALDLGIDQPEGVWLNIANACLAIGKRDAAEAALKKAIEICPDFKLAHLNLGTLVSEAGEKERASQHFLQVLSIDHDCGQAFERLANSGYFSSENDPQIVAMERRLNTPSMPTEERISAHFGLGRIYDVHKKYDEAFAHYQIANLLRKSVSRPYSRQSIEAYVDDAIAIPSTVWHNSSVAESDFHPIFIIGMFRSGTTLMEQVLSVHQQVSCAGEVSYFDRTLGRKLLASLLSTATTEDFVNLATGYRNLLRSRNLDAAGLLTDKRPDNFLYVGAIKKAFPQAKFIHMNRHPLDNALSIYFQNLNEVLSYSHDLADIGHYILQQRRIMDYWKSIFPSEILEVSYDRFVQNQPEVTAEVLRFCGLDWTDSCLNFHESDNPVNTASIWQVRQPLYRHASGRWRNYARHLTALREIFPEAQ